MRTLSLLPTSCPSDHPKQLSFSHFGCYKHILENRHYSKGQTGVLYYLGSPPQSSLLFSATCYRFPHLASSVWSSLGTLPLLTAFFLSLPPPLPSLLSCKHILHILFSFPPDPTYSFIQQKVIENLLPSKH